MDLLLGDKLQVALNAFKLRPSQRRIFKNLFKIFFRHYIPIF